MIYRCAFCGKTTKPYVLIGNEAVGPTCARRAGLTKKSLAWTKVQFVKTGKGRLKENPNLSLFDDQEVSKCHTEHL